VQVEAARKSNGLLARDIATPLAKRDATGEHARLPGRRSEAHHV